MFLDLSNLKAKYSTKACTSLSTFLTIYIKANRECYLDYMEGASALIEYLSPIEMHLQDENDRPLPPLAISYELHQLAKLIWPQMHTQSVKDWIPALRRTERAILEETMKLYKKGIV